LDSGYYRNTASAHKSDSSVATLGAEPLLLVVASPTPMKQTTHLWKEKRWLLQMAYRARFFVLGCEELLIAVDHKPLLKTFGDCSLNDIENPRLRNLKEKTLQYRFKMVHLPGARNKAADAVFHHPTDTD